MNINYDMVDLGLPSGTLWAKCNLGALDEKDVGCYFQWGSTKGYTTEEVKQTKYLFKECNTPCVDTFHKIEKYSTLNGISDIISRNAKSSCDIFKSRLDNYEDAVTKYMGLSYHMPTRKEIEELIEHTIVSRTNLGYKITSRINGRQIFIPCSGYASENTIHNITSSAFLWSSDLSGSYNALCIEVSSDTLTNRSYSRYFGHVIRAVCKPQQKKRMTS